MRVTPTFTAEEKLEVVLRKMRGESFQRLNLETRVPIGELQRWVLKHMRGQLLKPDPPKRLRASRKSRWTPEKKLEIVLRYLQGEKLEDLHKEYKLAVGVICDWKKVVLAAARERLRHPTQCRAGALTKARRALDDLYDDIKDWNPDVEIRRIKDM